MIAIKSSKPAVHRIEGTNVTRKSPRYYTHAVVANYDLAAAIADNSFVDYQAKDTWEYYHAKAGAEAGKPVTFPPAHKGGRPIVLHFEQSEIEKAQDFIIANPTLEAYLTFRRSEHEAHCRRIEDGALQVLQWSQSERNAVKAASSKSVRRVRNVRNVRVVKVTRG